MAQFLVVRDPDALRRAGAMAKAQRMLAEDRGLQVSSVELEGLSVVWGVGDHTPVDVHAGSNGWCLVLGEILSGPGPERSTASDYLASAGGVSAPFDGLHAGVIVSPGGGLTVGADLLGIFPVCYTDPGETLLVASAPGLLKCHPSFQCTIDPLGLTGLLLTNSIIDGVTIFRAVRRLGAGDRLQAAAGGPVREELQYRFPVTCSHHDQPLHEWSRRLHEAFVASCRRHVRAGVSHAFMMSGGLDSRLMAGVLRKQGATVTAVIKGLPSDTDLRSGQRVARHLGFPLQLVITPGGGTWENFRNELRWNGMNACPHMDLGVVVEAVRGHHSRIVSGYLMDAILGGSHMHWCYSHARHDTSRETWFRFLNSLAISVETLRGLLRPEIFGASIDEMLERIRQRFMRSGDSNLERTWRFDLEHRQRFYIGGPLLAQMKGAWAVAPHIDREVLETAGGIPLGAVADRLVERDMVIRFHRDIARLPLDRGDDADNSPLDPDVRAILRALPGRALKKVATALRLPQRDRRAWRRTFSLESPAWSGVRREWESHRELAYALFVPEALDSYLPPIGSAWPRELNMNETIGRKIIMAATLLNS